jgi:hypothetical protein
MPNMCRTLAALAAAVALLPATAAPAASITASRSHDPKLGCKAIEVLVANLGKGRLEDPRGAAFIPTFYSDRFGEVEDSEEAAFLHALRHSEGKRDRGPIRLDRVHAVHPDRFHPIDLVVLERESWHETRLETDGMLETQEIRDPRYVRETSHWLVTFHSNDIMRFREAPEMYQLGDESNALRHCRQD